jgi:PKD repeat protein
MRNYLLLFFMPVITLLTITGYGQSKLVNSGKNVPVEQVDTRIDNMRYWNRMAEKGLVPYNAQVPVKPAEYQGSLIEIKGVTIADSPDVPVTNLTNVTESENSVFVDPNNNQYLLNSNNSTSWSGGSVGSLYGANYFQSANGGTTWGGSYQGAGGANSGDPTTAIGINGREYVNYISGAGGQGIAYSDNGSSWLTATIAPNPGSLADKNHMWIDNSSVSSHEGNLYTAWTDFGGTDDAEIKISRSTNDGVNWSTPVNISSAVNAGSHNQGVNIQTGPNGEVYVCWAIYDSWPSDETAIGFAKSTNGGVSYNTATRIISSIKGIRTTETSKSHRVNSFPVMAVDISGGSNNGNLYIVWSNVGVPGTNTGTNISVYMIRSTNGGTSWSTPVRVNQGPSSYGYEAYFPWITCDPETGSLAVVYYDDRGITTHPTTSCETWVAYSTNAGANWSDFRVSDVSFTPSPIPGLASSYMGDYLGITSRGNYFYPCWTDTRGGLFMTYVSAFTLGLNASFTASETTICTGSSVVFTDNSSGPPTTWTWSFPGGTPSGYSGSNPPAITYNSPGVYDVSLTVGDGSTTDTETKTGYITVQNVFADFTGTPTSVVVGNTVTFTDNSGCSPASWSWSFPGGTPATATGAGPHTITYNTIGTYNVSLTVTKGTSNDTETKANYISVIAPEFNMTTGTVTTCTGNFYDSGGPSSNYADNENFTETFYPSTPGAMIRFVFSSFSSESGFDYLYIYNGVDATAPLIGTYNGTTNPGTITASNAAGALTFVFTSDYSVTSSGWAAAISCYSNTSPPVANFSASTTTPAINSTVNFADNSTNIPTSWSWSFTPNTVTYVGGTTSTSQNPQVQFTATGYYTVSLTVTNAYGSDTETKTNYINVTLNDYCIPTYTYGTYDGDYISLVQLGSINNATGASASPYYTYYSSLSTNLTPGNAYTVTLSPGTYTSGNYIAVWIDYNQNGLFETTEKLGNILIPPMPSTGTINFTVPASATTGTTRMRVREAYYTTNIDPCANYSYGETEDYNVNIQGTGTAPVADFSASDTSPFIAETVIFSDLSSNTPTTWNWSFNPATVAFVNGTNAGSQNPQVQFGNAGFYTVTLTASNSYGSDSEIKTNYIEVIETIPPYVEDFESFSSGNYVALTSDYWTTWSELPGGTEDALIVTNPTFSGTKSVKIDGLSDLVLPLGDKTSGKYIVSFYMYIPTGYYGYYNLLQDFNGSASEWGAEVFFSTGGSGYGNAGGANSFTFSYSYNTWIYVKNFIDIDNNLAQIWINDNLSHQWIWSTGALGDGTLNQLGGLDMYAWNVNGTPLFYFDNLSYYELLQLDMTVFLEGPFNGFSMTPGLAGVLPLSQPYNMAPWNYNGSESVAGIPNANVIDWVLIEVRDAISADQATSGTMAGRQAAFILNNGKVVGLDGTSVLRFEVPVLDNLYTVVHHRNHLSIMSAIELNKIAGIYSYNFTTGAGQAYGEADAQKQIAPGVWGMMGGDGDRSGLIGTGDKSPIWTTDAGTRGYLETDYNLDAQTNNIDKDDVWVPNIGKGSQVPE